MKFAELKTKEVVRLSDGKKLGFADDIVIDEATNTVVALRIPKASRAFRKPEYIEIPFSNITKIGENVILVSAFGDNFGDGCVEEVRYELIFSPRIFKRADGRNKK